MSHEMTRHLDERPAAPQVRKQMMLTKFLRFGAFAGVLTLSATALGATVLAMELADLVRDADHVVTATAVEEEVFRDERGRIITDVTIEIGRTIKGSTSRGDVLHVRTLGGIIGDVGMRVPGEPNFPVGTEHVLFLRDERSHCRSVGMSQGAMRITEEGDQAMVNPGASGLRLVERNGDHLVPGAAAFLHPIALEDFLAQLEALVDSQAGADPAATE